MPVSRQNRDAAQDVALSAPARMTMRASVDSPARNIPSCSYYNEEIGSWDESGLVTESMAVSAGESFEAQGQSDVIFTCFSFHLSDFTVSSMEMEASFRPVDLVRN